MTPWWRVATSLPSAPGANGKTLDDSASNNSITNSVLESLPSHTPDRASGSTPKGMLDISLPAVGDYPVASVDYAEVFRYLGMGSAMPDKALTDKVEEAVRSALDLARPRAALRVFRLRDTNTQPLELEGARLKLAGSDIERFLSGACEVAVFVVTLGLAIDRELQRLSATNALSELVFDAAATTLIERAADAVSAKVVAYAASRGMQATGRFSPGYGDLPLSCQTDLLASVDAMRLLGVTLTASNLMVPTKSVSGVMGIGQNVAAGTDDGVANRKGACGICKLRDFCALRKTGRTCRG